MVSVPHVCRALWGTSPTNLYAVGQQGTVVHRNEDEIWLKVASQTPHSLRRIWGDGNGTVWIVGDFGVLLHGDSEGFQQVVDPNAALTTADYLYGVWVTLAGRSSRSASLGCSSWGRQMGLRTWIRVRSTFWKQ